MDLLLFQILRFEIFQAFYFFLYDKIFFSKYDLSDHFLDHLFLNLSLHSFLMTNVLSLFHYWSCHLYDLANLINH